MVTGIAVLHGLPNGVPGADDSVVIDHDITITDARSCASLSINFTDPVNTLTITGSSASLTC